MIMRNNVINNYENVEILTKKRVLNYTPVVLENKRSRILKLALPVIAGLSTQTLLSLIDTAMIGRLPDAKYALAAMGIAFLATWAVVSFFSSLSTGTHVLTARNYGSKDYEECGNVLNTSIIMGFIIGMAVSFLVVYFSYQIANVFAADNIVGRYAGEYLFYRFMGIPFFLITVSYRGFYFGIGKTKVFMIAGITASLLNILFDYSLIYGAFGLTAMGLAGAGLGSALATVVETTIYLIFSSLRKCRQKFNLFKNIKYKAGIAKNIVKLSLPISFQSIFTLIGFLLFMSIIGITGTLQQAASQTVLSTLFVSFMPAIGFGIAAQTLVGNKLGEDNIAEAKQWGFETSKIALTYTIFLGFIFILFPKIIIPLLTSDSSIVEVAIPLMRIAGFAQVFIGIGFVLANGLLSAGESLFVMLADVTINLFIFVPVAYLFGIILNLGVEGVWLAMPFYTSLYALVIFLKFKYGKWNKYRP